MSDDKDRAIAEALTALGLDEGLAWEPAKVCPQGHSLGSVFIGRLCSRCVDDYLMAHDHLSYYQEALEEMQRMPDVIKKEWRIGRIPHDFTNPTFLLPAARAYCQYRNKVEGRAYGIQISYIVVWSEREGGYARIAPECDIDDDFEKMSRGSDEMDALRDALHAAITGEVEA